MQKLKKALKKVMNLGTKKPATPAKKATAPKKKAPPVLQAKPTAKSGSKPAKKSAEKSLEKSSEKSAGKAPVKSPAKAAEKTVSAKSSAAHAKGAPAKPASNPVAAAKDAKKKPAASSQQLTDSKPAKAKAEAKPQQDSIAASTEGSTGAVKKRLLEKPAAKTTENKTEPSPQPAPSVETDPNSKSAKAKKAKDELVATENAINDDEIILTDADGRRYCRVKECDQLATVDGYCRFHYLLFWKNIQNRKKILSEGKLERYVEELTARYPDKFLELLRKDLRSEKDFNSAIQELEIDDSGADNEFEDEAQSYLDEVRGMSSEPTSEREEDF